MESLRALLQDDQIFLTPGGLETTLYFKTSFPLREMAAFELLLSAEWSDKVRNMQFAFVDTAVKHGRPMILDTETWRASSKWYDKLDISPENREKISKLATDFAKDLANRMKDNSNGRLVPVVQGVVGPEYDGYVFDEKTTVENSRQYHRRQIKSLQEAGVDLITSMTMTNSMEALAIALESTNVGMPCVISFTLRSDGHLPSGETLREAIRRIDGEVETPPLFYMVNCVHPTYIEPVLKQALEKREGWVKRLRGVKANASSKSHDELDNSEELDEGNPREWAEDMLRLRHLLPNLNVLGGCCGTGIRHCDELGKLVQKEYMG